VSTVLVHELDLDLDAFEGPFDLLLSLVLREELAMSDVAVAEIVLAFVERLAERELIDVEACGEFLVLVAALLELKARALLAEDGDGDVEDLDPEEAAAELAERLAEYRRVKAGADWLGERLAAQSDRYFRLGPAPLTLAPDRPLAPQDPVQLAAALRALATEPPTPSLAHFALKLPPVEVFLERFRTALRQSRTFVFDEEVDGLSRIQQAVAFLALLELRKTEEVRLEQRAPFEPITVWNASSTS
jgi:segregation and condensation protein A